MVLRKPREKMSIRAKLDARLAKKHAGERKPADRNKLTAASTAYNRPSDSRRYRWHPYEPRAVPTISTRPRMIHIDPSHVITYINSQMVLPEYAARPGGRLLPRPWVEILQAHGNRASTPKEKDLRVCNVSDIGVIQRLNDMPILAFEATCLSPFQKILGEQRPVAIGWNGLGPFPRSAMATDVEQLPSMKWYTPSMDWVLSKSCSMDRHVLFQSSDGFGFFNRENWEVPHVVWNRTLKPAAALAWKMFTTERSMDWLEHLATGHVHPHPNHLGYEYIAENTYNRSGTNPWVTEEARKSVQEVFDTLNEFLKFRLVRTDHLQSQDRVEAGDVVHGHCLEFKHREQHPLDPDQVIPFGHRPEDWIEINILQDIAKSAAGLKPGSPRWMAWTFSMAKTLCHEAAHAFWRGLAATSSDRAYVISQNKNEPYHRLKDGTAELGFSWEVAVLGHEFEMVMPRNQPTSQPMYWTGPTTLHTSKTQYIPPESWVQKWFEVSTWKKIEEEGIGFMNRAAREYRQVSKANFPYNGWFTHFMKGPEHVREVPAMINKPGINAPVLLTLRWSDANGRWESALPPRTAPDDVGAGPLNIGDAMDNWILGCVADL
jgi:hypothetical protein